MKKMTIAEAASYFGVSKEAIHNRIRRGSLDCIVENGVKLVTISIAKSDTPKASDSSEEGRYTRYIEEENNRLRERVDVLEKETTRLRDQREQMLIEERVKIEQIYKERDAQLRSVLHVVATKFLSHANADEVVEEAVTAEVIDHKDSLVSLKSFLKLKGYKEKQKKKIKERFESIKAADFRIIEKEGKIYIDPSRYDYSDLLKG